VTGIIEQRAARRKRNLGGLHAPAVLRNALHLLHLQHGLVELSGQELPLTDPGRPFLRNATMFFDERLRRQRPQTQIFSQAL
jgi:hypothetical protein